jgi:formylglycine-generating enzyme required for sulfatase activity
MPGTKVVNIYYNLADADGDTQTIEVRVSSDGGLTYSVPATSLTGAVGSGVAVGTGKHVLWDAGTDFGGNFIERCKVRITATDGNLPSAPAGMMAIPAGYFQMGDTLEGAGSPTANILINQFYIDRTEVSKGKWDEVRVWAEGNGFTDLRTGSSYNGALHPVHSITWDDAVKWCNARSIKENLVPCYYTNAAKTNAYIYKTGSTILSADMVAWTANGYRLPTEAEWEKAARGGLTNKRFPSGDTITHNDAVYYADSASFPTYDLSSTQGWHPTYFGTAPCGSLSANGYGLYDMAGNLWEWTWDYSGGTLGTPSANNPTGPAYSSYRILRGGHGGISAYYARCAHRGYDGVPSDTNGSIGFRAVRR